MRKLLPTLLPLAAAQLPAADPVYPAATRGENVDVYHGTKIADPYRGLGVSHLLLLRLPIGRGAKLAKPDRCSWFVVGRALRARR